MNPNVNHELWMIMLYKYRFIDCNKCTTVVYNISSSFQGRLCPGSERGTWTIYSTKFSYVSKTTLKIVYLKLNNNKMFMLINILEASRRWTEIYFLLNQNEWLNVLGKFVYPRGLLLLLWSLATLLINI